MLKIGHRGACGHAPENTLKSIRKAIDLGVDMVEFDVQTCKSGEVVVIHDRKVNKTTNGKGCVKKFSLNELGKLKLNEDEKMPTLIEALDFIDKRVKVNIEIKDKCASFVADIIKKYIEKNNWNASDFLVSSFDWKELEKIRNILPEIQIGILVGNRIKGLIKYRSKNIINVAKKLAAHCVIFSSKSITKEKIEFMHEHELKVFVYTVNEAFDMLEMEKIGVDGIFSDYPERIYTV